MPQGPEGGGGGTCPEFWYQLETEPKSGGGNKQRQRSGDLPIPLNTGVMGQF